MKELYNLLPEQILVEYGFFVSFVCCPCFFVNGELLLLTVLCKNEQWQFWGKSALGILIGVVTVSTIINWAVVVPA